MCLGAVQDSAGHDPLGLHAQALPKAQRRRTGGCTRCHCPQDPSLGCRWQCNHVRHFIIDIALFSTGHTNNSKPCWEMAQQNSLV